MNLRLLKPEEIECRIGNVISTSKWQGYTLLLYKNARADMAILDEMVGAENWQRKHYAVKDNMYCSVGIRCNGEWVWKDDCGTESFTEKEKGEASDSFKRACVNWGIGRELYTSPQIYIACQLDDGKVPNNEKYRKFDVIDIDYNNGEISRLFIADRKTGEVVFKYPRNAVQKVREDINNVISLKDNEEV